MLEQRNIEFLASSCIHTNVSIIQSAGGGGLHAETLYGRHYFSLLDNRVCFTKADLRWWVWIIQRHGLCELRTLMHLYPLVSSHTNMMHTLPAVLKLCSIYFSVRPTRLKQGSLFHTSLQSPVHQCKIPHPCRQRQMEGAAPAPCSAPVIYATVAKTHMHAHTHLCIHTYCMHVIIHQQMRSNAWIYTHTHTLRAECMTAPVLC